jgi:hypothetical protein
LSRRCSTNQSPIGKQWKNGNDTVTGVVGNTRDMELNNTEALSVYY